MGLNRDDFGPQGHVAMSGDMFGCYKKRVCYWQSGQRPCMLLNILQAPTIKHYLAPNINSAKAEKPCIRLRSPCKVQC